LLCEADVSQPPKKGDKKKKEKKDDKQEKADDPNEGLTKEEVSNLSNAQ
jgi:hypothetical protein